MFTCYLTNFGYPLQETRDTLDAAIEYGKSKGFEFVVYRNGTEPVASWTVFGGTKKRNPLTW